jgi:hypothetical protein
MKQLSLLILATLTLAAGATSALAAEGANSSATAGVVTNRPLTRTVGIHVVTRTVNPDQSLTLLYRWNDSRLGRDVERSVILTKEAVIGINGQLKQLSDVTEEALKAPSVATVGPDMTNVVFLRIGREKIRATEADLTPKQAAALREVAPKPTAASDAALERRVAEMVSDLKLNDAAKEERLRTVLTTDLKAVRESHNAGFAPAKNVRQDLNAGLAANLTPQQIDAVKNALTHGQVKHTFDTYHQIIPELTAEDDKFILAKLNAAREEALDVKNADQLGPIFEPYKTEIEKYITAHHRDWKTAYKAFVAKRNASQRQE